MQSLAPGLVRGFIATVTYTRPLINIFYEEQVATAAVDCQGACLCKQFVLTR